MATDEGFFFTVTAKDTSGIDIPDFIPKYASSNTAVVSIEEDGRMRAEAVGTVTITARAGGQTAQATIYVGQATYNLASLGLPKVLDANFIDLSKVERISRFRSTVGHSYVDGSGETCRSMKHYYQPFWPDVDWTTVDIYAPVTGTIVGIAPDGPWGKKILIRPRDLPSMYVMLFHVNLNPDIFTAGWLNSGQHVGKHSSNNTSSDIAIFFDSKEDGALVSYFDTMTDAVFEEYKARGASSRADFVITKEERDADAVPCTGEQQFTVHGTLEDWVMLD